MVYLKIHHFKLNSELENMVYLKIHHFLSSNYLLKIKKMVYLEIYRI